MSVVLIVISKEIIRRNILDTEFWPIFLTRKLNNKKIVLVVNEDAVSDYESYNSDKVEVVGYKKIKPSGLYVLLNFFIRISLDSHSVRTYRNRAFVRGQCSLTSFLVKGFLSNTLGRSPVAKSFIRYIFLKTRGSKEINRLFEKYNPNSIFVPSMIDNEFDAQFAKVAKQRKVKVVGMVRSWDNFNNHGLLSVVPDIFYLQNKFLVEAAKKFQAINLDKIKYEVIGLPHYDDYYDSSTYVKSKQEFFDSMGLDLNKKLILLGGSDFYYSEDSFPTQINQMIESGAIPETQVIFRPHSSSLFSKDDYRLEKLKHIILDDAFRGGKFKDKDKFINLLFHSDIVINIASTLSIDAAVFDKPVICINFDSKSKNLSRYEKTGVLYTHFDHYERLVATKGVKLPKSVSELADCINDYYQDPCLDKEGRLKIIEEFASPFYGRSSQRLADLINSDLN